VLYINATSTWPVFYLIYFISDEPPAKDHSYAKYVYKFDSEKHPEQIRSIGTQTDLSANEIENLIREKGEQQSSSCHTKDHFMQTATSSDKKVKFYTGVSSLHIFLGLFKILEPVILKYYSGTGSVNEKRYERGGEKPGPSRKLTKYEEFTLTLIRLRHAVPVTLLADLFNVSSSRVSQVFTTWIYHISEVSSRLIVWPSRQLIKKHMPPSFKKKFPKCRSIIDCTEIFIERPRNPTTQAKTYSNYKSHNTYKTLVSITPTGAFNFVSDVWGGNTSDKYITEHSGYLDNISAGDEVMADRGFLIRDLLTERRAYLTIPPFTRTCSFGKGRRLNSNEIKRTRAIANCRIHVERAIQRLKEFKMLSNIIQWSLKPIVNPMLKVAAFLCNFMKPLVKK